MLQGRSNTDSSLIIQFDGRYAYWGSKSQTWIYDSFLHHIADKFVRISERDARKFIRTGAPPRTDYQHVNPKIDGMRI
jgi:hypothetical protein